MGTAMSRPTLPRGKCLLLMFFCFSVICCCCFFYAAIVYRNTASLDAQNVSSAVDVVVPFVKANKVLMSKFLICVSSMLDHLSSDVRLLRLHIIGDEDSITAAKRLITKAAMVKRNRSTPGTIKLITYDLDSVAAFTDILVGPIKRHFIYKPGAYYSDAFFFFSIVLHRLLPAQFGRVVMLDVDLRFRADVGQLHAEFDRFDESQMIGIAYEQQPVYRHIFNAYRKLVPETGVGSDPRSGFPGFNSGVLLLDLDRMRSSKQYDRFLDAFVVDDLALKYKFQGHLGDQDYFTLIAIENRHLFYVLDCTWNRQLCTWWRDLGYQDVFDVYHECKNDLASTTRDGVKIFHGNCNTAIPND